MYSRHAIGSPLHVGLVPSNYPRLCPAYAISRGYAISHSQCWAPLLKKTATVVATFLVRFASAYPNGFPPPGLWRQMGSGGCPPGTLPCLQGIVCYTHRPQRHGNRAYDVTKRPLPPAGERLRMLAGIQSQGRKRADIIGISPSSLLYTVTTKRKGPATLNCTPFVRQYGILSNKWGVLLCQKEYQTNDIRRNSKNW